MEARLTRTSENGRAAEAAKRAAAREVMEQLVTHDPRLGSVCPQCAEAVGDHLVALSAAVDALAEQARALAWQIVIGTMPVEWRGEKRLPWIAALNDEDERQRAALILVHTSAVARENPAQALEVINERQAKLDAWRKRLEAALQAIDKHSPLMGDIVRRAVDDLIAQAAQKA